MSSNLQAQRFIWLILPVALIAMSVWAIVTGVGTYRFPLGIILGLCIVACVRQGFLLWTNGQTAYASVAFAGAVIGLAAPGAISFFHLL
jgi:hypothetical protein